MTIQIPTMNTAYKVLAASVAALVIHACSDSTSVTPATTTTTTTTSPASTPAAVAYSGPGSKWDFDLAADGTFSIERSEGYNQPIDTTIDGTYARLDSGFVKLSVTASTGANAPSSGDEAWALEVPGYALLVKPMEPGSDQMIAMVAAGSCPTGDFDANWVLVKQDVGRDTSDPLADYTGTFSYNATSGEPELPAKFSLTDPLTNLGAFALGAGNCDTGILAFDGATLYLTDNGGAIVHTTGDDPVSEDDDNFIFALGQKAIGNISDLDGDYVGMLYDETGDVGSKVTPVIMNCVTGTCTGNMVIDIDTGATENNGSVTVSLTGTVDTPATGMIVGTISDNTNTGGLTCMVDKDVSGTGKRIVSCVGQSPGDLTKMFNVMFVSK